MPSETPESQLLAHRYQLQQLLGKKAGRQTWLAKDLQTEAWVVVKRLTFGAEFEWDDLRLFEREAQVLQSLSHPAIPQYLDYFEVDLPTGKGFALVQSYIQAQSLEQHLKAGRSFSESEVKQIARDLLEILIYLHDRQPPVIHRDIKPSNILLGNRSGNSLGQVYLVDFGAVQTLLAKEGSTMTIVGTYGYMPPEQFGGRAFPASDLYSLGATLIYLVTGQHPADLQDDLRIEFQAQTNLSPAFAHWLRRMTAPSRQQRFESARAALEALERSSTAAIVPVVEKPKGSQVLLSKDDRSLEILIPPAGCTVENLIVALFAIGWNTILLIMTVAILMHVQLQPPILGVFVLPFWLAGLKLLVRNIRRLFEYRSLQFTETAVLFKHEILIFEFFRHRSIQRQSVTQIEMMSVNRSRSKIIFHTDDRIHTLTLHYRLTPEELDWLASELREWLGISVEQIDSATRLSGGCVVAGSIDASKNRR